QLADLSRPIMRRRTCLDLRPDRAAAWQNTTLPADAAAHDGRRPRRIDRMHLKNLLSQVQPDRCNLFMDGSRPLVWLKTNFGTIDAVRGSSTPPSPAKTIKIKASIGVDRHNRISFPGQPCAFAGMTIGWIREEMLDGR